MRLTKMEITGFKSFADKTVIEFPVGISAIVGPNGCGKSNIVDALRWAMGEQSVKQLRGKSMEDVIFAGSNGRPPMNMSEVTLTLSNENGDAPEEFRDFSEIHVTRRLFRSGESAYLINKTPCRLKDIHHIFLGSGVGTKSYAIIQQGSIGTITEAGPDERRFFIEEAAGISRYKSRRNEAIHKLEATQANLLRLADVITEVERQMASLKRQAKKSELYKQYQTRIRELDALIAIFEYDHLSLDMHQTDTLLKSLKDADIEYSSKLEQLNSAIEQIKLKRTEKNDQIQEHKSERFEIQRRIDRLENEIAHLRKDMERLTEECEQLNIARDGLEEKNQKILSEIAQAEAEHTILQEQIQNLTTTIDQQKFDSLQFHDQLTVLNGELDRSKKILSDLTSKEAQYRNIHETASNNKESVKRRLKRINEEEVISQKQTTELEGLERAAQNELTSIRNELNELTEQIESVKAQLNEKNKLLGDQVKTTQTLELERNKVKSRYSALKKMEDNFEWYKDGVKALLKRSGSETDYPMLQDGIVGLIADIIDPEPSYQAAVEAVLGDALQYILVQHVDIGMNAIDFLCKQNAGRCGFIPVTEMNARSIHAAPDLSSNSSIRMNSITDPNMMLLNHIKVTPGFEKIAEILLGNILVVKDMHEAKQIASMNGNHSTVVSLSGDVVFHDGMIIGGSKDKLSGILAKKQEIRDIDKQLTDLTHQLEAARDTQKRIESDVRTLESQLQKDSELKSRVIRSEIEAEKKAFKLSEELKHARRQLDMIRMEQEKLQGEESDIDNQLEQYHRAMAQVTNEIHEVQAKISSIENNIAAVSSKMEEYNRRIMDYKLQMTTLHAKLDTSILSLKRLKEFQIDGVKRLEQFGRDIVIKEEKLMASQRKIKEYEQALGIMYDALKEKDMLIESTEADYQSIDDEIRKSDQSISGIQKDREEILEKIRMLNVEQTQRQLRRDHINQRLVEKYGQSIQAFKQEFEQVIANTSCQPNEMEAELAELRKKLTAIGDVNLGAIDEYKELAQRYEFLCSQRDDLNKAIDDLHKVIRKINQISQERFMATFNQVNEKLQEIFPRLFEGGSASLVLTEPSKPLETGVEFMVHPPGKKLTRLSLLSGGEKALAAIAFIFSIFLIKPASFCIMDEIDAPLDDANVIRFNELLKIIGEKSQIIMITHKKRSMEFADTLFGITMEKKGISKIVSVNLNKSEDKEHAI